MSFSHHKNKHFIHLTYKDALKMALKSHSCIEKVEHEKVLSMSPKFINSIRIGLKETLNKDLFVYNNSLNGVPFAFGKIHINKSEIIDDLERFNLTLEVSYMVFKPRLGKILRATINKIADHHLGCLIHGCINGSIIQPNFDYLSASQKEIIDNIKVGSEVLFTITKIDNHNDILFVVGEIAPQFYLGKKRKAQSSEEFSAIKKIKEEIE
ncbi:DNA-directed RNA polymerase I subunit RPA43 [Hydra vulgaris]|uniref:DNA-directed RNA polymerase I subunit RPA43 n=1 Tax=Hydra vulgaris TaxID=6087 RepID=UPI001F5FA6C5|nr:DNA-directed RNA polymerase I subunit RPA43-like [Hydra vulgaris]